MKCECGKEHADWVPQARLDEVTAQRRDLSARLEAETNKATSAASQLAEAAKKAGSVDAVTAQLADLRAAHARDVAGWGTERALLEAGITDPEGRAIAQHLYGRLPEEGRPELSAWLGAHRADPTKAPKGLVPYLPSAGGGGTTTAAAGSAAGAGATAGAGGAAGAGVGHQRSNPNATAIGGGGQGATTWTPEAIASVGKQTPEQIRAALPSIMGSIRGAA